MLISRANKAKKQAPNASHKKGNKRAQTSKNDIEETAVRHTDRDHIMWKCGKTHITKNEIRTKRAAPKRRKNKLDHQHYRSASN